MKKYVIILLFAFPLFSCGTKYNYTDTGTANAYFDGNMYEYLQSNSYDWDSVRLIIDRAGLQGVFMHDDITFLGLTNHSIRKWLIQGGTGYQQGYKQVSDIPEDLCRAIVNSLVIDGKIMRDHVERATFDEKGNRNGGGRKVKARYGNDIWLWTRQDKWMGVEGMGPVKLSMTTLQSDQKTEIATNVIASSDIQPHNGIVQAIEYSYNIDNIGKLPINQ